MTWPLSMSCSDVTDELIMAQICLFHWIIIWVVGGGGADLAACFNPPPPRSWLKSSFKFKLIKMCLDKPLKKRKKKRICITLTTHTKGAPVARYSFLINEFLLNKLQTVQQMEKRTDVTNSKFYNLSCFRHAPSVASAPGYLLLPSSAAAPRSSSASIANCPHCLPKCLIHHLPPPSPEWGTSEFNLLHDLVKPLNAKCWICHVSTKYILIWFLWEAEIKLKFCQSSGAASHDWLFWK